MKNLSPELIGILLVGVAILAFIAQTSSNHTDALAALKVEVATDLRVFQAEAASDRRAFQAAMDEFRREILRLSERQARLEAMQEAQASTTTTGS